MIRRCAKCGAAAAEPTGGTRYSADGIPVGMELLYTCRECYAQFKVLSPGATLGAGCLTFIVLGMFIFIMFSGRVASEKDRVLILLFLAPQVAAFAIYLWLRLRAGKRNPLVIADNNSS